MGLPEATFLRLDELRPLYRDLFSCGPRKAYRDGELTFPGDWQAIASETDSQQWLGPLAAIDWVVRMEPDRRG